MYELAHAGLGEKSAVYLTELDPVYPPVLLMRLFIYQSC
jgi:hypothetical protein